ncbi:T9SS type A sorting domain-containing protein [Saccharicrinis sp. FJH54]|uniref:T9SS type A sorting domain-containing protein n=1 Tax=Saccharicrinis sp. FJH54 TaxID=3344665 RepID=UPI0035D524C5
MKTFALILIWFGWFSFASAQEAITTTGGSASDSNGTVSYTVGQIAYQTQTGTNGSVAEGVQQPFEISVISSIKETDGISLNFIVYPNPAKTNLTLDIADFELSNLIFELFDVNGKILKTGKITNTRTNIDITSLESASYLVKVIRDNQEIKTFKVIKY